MDLVYCHNLGDNHVECQFCNIKYNIENIIYAKRIALKFCHSLQGQKKKKSEISEISV